MASLTLQASKTSGQQSVTVTRSTDDALGSAIAAVVLDNTLSALQVREAFTALAERIGEDWRAVSRPAQLGSGADHAFADDADFADGAQFGDQGGGSVTWLATLANDNSVSVTRDNSGTLGPTADMAIVVNASKGKPELWHYLRGLERELLRLGKTFTSPADYPTTGSRVAS